MTMPTKKSTLMDVGIASANTNVRNTYIIAGTRLGDTWVTCRNLFFLHTKRLLQYIIKSILFLSGVKKVMPS